MQNKLVISVGLLRIAILTGFVTVIIATTVHAEWITYYKNKSGSTVYYYNSEKMKNTGGVITLWTKTTDSYPGKIEIDCKKSTYKSLDDEVKDIAPDTMIESLEKAVCQSKPAGDK